MKSFTGATPLWNMDSTYGNQVINLIDCIKMRPHHYSRHVYMWSLIQGEGSPSSSSPLQSSPIPSVAVIQPPAISPSWGGRRQINPHIRPGWASVQKNIVNINDTQRNTAAAKATKHLGQVHSRLSVWAFCVSCLCLHAFLPSFFFFFTPTECLD